MKSSIHPAYLGFNLGRDWYAQISSGTRTLNRDWYTFITKMFKVLPKMGCIDAEQVLATAYEMEYEIYPHLQKSKGRPLSTVAMHDCEDPNSGSLLENVIRAYSLKNIREHFGMSLLEYLDQPVDIVDMLNTIADEDNKRKASIVSGIHSDMQNITKEK